ncbi:MAG: LLM class flavin-dependent oxidoreductase, partial [Actinomycetota bacterium]
RLEELVDVLRLAWGPGRFTYQGRHLSFTDVEVTPKPARPIPIWLGGAAEPALRRAARIADGYFPPSTAGVSDIAARAEQVLQMRHDAGVEGPFGYGVFLPVGIGRDADDAWASIRDGVLHVRGSYMLWGRGERDVSGARDAALPFEAEVRASCVVGTPAEVASQLRPIAEKLDGLDLADVFTSVVLVPPGMTRARAAEAIERFATEVVPRLG